jgi:hypothetical protein
MATKNTKNTKKKVCKTLIFFVPFVPFVAKSLSLHFAVNHGISVGLAVAPFVVRIPGSSAR